MKIAIIGTGYVGLVTGICFADAGNQVLCVDNNLQKLESLEQGQIPIYEPGLDVLFERARREERIAFTNSLQRAADECELLFFCLPTPPGADGQADLSFILEVAGQLGPMLTEHRIVVNKSTVPVGTADLVRQRLAETASVTFDVVSNPEFLREGVAVEDFLHPERVVVGTSSPQAAKKMKQLYAPFVEDINDIIIMDEHSSELTKYAANSFLAMRISFMNEIAQLCERAGADVDLVRRGIGTDSRIGPKFLFAGIGYGGSCFPKDVQALHYTAGNLGYDFKILDAVMKVNSNQKESLVRKVEHYYGTRDLSGKTFAVWGLAFKPDTDDVREAPSLQIIKALLQRGAKVQAYDPEAINTFKTAIGPELANQIQFVEHRNEALLEADALLICTEWKEFRNADINQFHERLKEPVLFDGRNIFTLDYARESNLTYISIGREDILPATE